MIHTVKDFGVVSKAEVDVFLELSCFFYDPTDVGNLISGSSAFIIFKIEGAMRDWAIRADQKVLCQGFLTSHREGKVPVDVCYIVFLVIVVV